jgi:hypothetical protein
MNLFKELESTDFYDIVFIHTHIRIIFYVKINIILHIILKLICI